ncbi:MAG: putative acetyltransferase, family [Adhaeribacter sp.]|jgi:hypothetical protein|nr:putative acetyltransferase, family [Adhaeribacter sp.]
MQTYTLRAATASDLPSLTHLANEYIYERLSESERAMGFLTGRFDLPAIEKMVNSATSIVACVDKELVGFVINSKLTAAEYPPLLQAMIQIFPELHYQGRPLTAYKYFFYGPVLVSKSHRGNSLLSRMFRQTIAFLQHQFELGIAFIHIHNHHSLNIHTNYLGQEVVGQFSFQTDIYHILVFPLADSGK